MADESTYGKAEFDKYRKAAEKYQDFDDLIEEKYKLPEEREVIETSYKMAAESYEGSAKNIDKELCNSLDNAMDMVKENASANEIAAEFLYDKAENDAEEEKMSIDPEILREELRKNLSSKIKDREIESIISVVSKLSDGKDSENRDNFKKDNISTNIVYKKDGILGMKKLKYDLSPGIAKEMSVDMLEDSKHEDHEKLIRNLATFALLPIIIATFLVVRTTSLSPTGHAIAGVPLYTMDYVSVASLAVLTFLSFIIFKVFD